MPQSVSCRDLAVRIGSRRMTPLLIEWDDPCRFSVEHLAYDGEEFPHVLWASVVVVRAGPKMELGPGAGMYCSAQVPHGVRARKGAKVTAIWSRTRRR